jgi:hypothetical protein
MWREEADGPSVLEECMKEDAREDAWEGVNRRGRSRDIDFGVGTE